jgi:O-succinylbenzoic acid--CoA ligase
MKLESVIGDDPREILRGLKAAIHGAGPALGLGMVRSMPADVRPGTAVASC